MRGKWEMEGMGRAGEAREEEVWGKVCGDGSFKWPAHAHKRNRPRSDKHLVSLYGYARRADVIMSSVGVGYVDISSWRK